MENCWRGRFSSSIVLLIKDVSVLNWKYSRQKVFLVFIFLGVHLFFRCACDKSIFLVVPRVLLSCTGCRCRLVWTWNLLLSIQCLVHWAKTSGFFSIWQINFCFQNLIPSLRGIVYRGKAWSQTKIAFPVLGWYQSVAMGSIRRAYQVRQDRDAASGCCYLVSAPFPFLQKISTRNALLVPVVCLLSVKDCLIVIFCFLEASVKRVFCFCGFTSSVVLLFGTV